MINFKLNINFSTRLYIGFGLVAAIFTIAFFIIFFNIRQEAGNKEDVMNNIQLIDELDDLYEDHIFKVNKIILLYSNKSKTDKLEKLLDGKNCKLNKWFKSKKRQIIEENIPETGEKIAAFEKSQKSLCLLIEKINIDSISSKEQHFGNLNKKIDKFKNTFIDIKHTVNEFKKEALSKDSKSNIKAIILTLMFIAIVLTAFISIFLVNFFTKPLKIAGKFAERVANGDLTGTIDHDRKDEFGTMINSINQMVVQLQNVIEAISQSSSSFSEISEDLNKNSKTISEGAMNQSSALEEVSASMEEMLANIRQSALNAQETEDIASNVTKNAEKGKDDMLKTTEMLENIAKKITQVSDIAFQTNILSLNASIESSKAGVSGKGFRVVAEEVGRLADQSREAADEIEELSDESSRLAENSKEVLKSLIEEINETYNYVLGITTASSEQEQGAHQINDTLVELNLISQTNAKSAELLTQKAEGLMVQAKMLQNLLGYFKTSER